MLPIKQTMTRHHPTSDGAKINKELRTAKRFEEYFLKYANQDNQDELNLLSKVLILPVNQHIYLYLSFTYPLLTLYFAST